MRASVRDEIGKYGRYETVLGPAGSRVLTLPHPQDGNPYFDGIASPWKVDVFVDGDNGDDLNSGRSWSAAYQTMQKGIDNLVNGSRLLVAPKNGGYSEVLTIGTGLKHIQIIGYGGRGMVYNKATSNGIALTNNGKDVTLYNIGLEGNGTGGGLKNLGRRLRVISCKLEAGATAVEVTLATIAAMVSSGSEDVNDGSDTMFIDTEIAYATTQGVLIKGTDHGPMTQLRFLGCRFHDNVKDFEEANGSGGSVTHRFRDLEIGDCVFLRGEDGAEPTAYILLNDDNGNKGVVHGCRFPTALTGGKNLVSTGLIWVGNFHTGGISTDQPS